MRLNCIKKIKNKRKLLYFKKEKRVKRDEKKKVHCNHTTNMSLTCAPPLVISRRTSPNVVVKR